MSAIVSDAALRVISELADGQQPAPALVAPRPFWQTEPCPLWCGETHADSAFYEDRNHSAAPGRQMDLTLYRVDQGDGTYTPATIDAAINQHYRDSEPTVSLNVPTSPRRYIADGEHDVEMTIPEVRALRDRLSLLLGLVETTPMDVELFDQGDGAARTSGDQIISLNAPFDSDDRVRVHLTQWTEPGSPAELEVTIDADITVWGCTPEQARDAAAQLREAADRIDALAEYAAAFNARIGGAK